MEKPSRDFSPRSLCLLTDSLINNQIRFPRLQLKSVIILLLAARRSLFIIYTHVEFDSPGSGKDFFEDAIVLGAARRGMKSTPPRSLALRKYHV